MSFLWKDSPGSRSAHGLACGGHLPGEAKPCPSLKSLTLPAAPQPREALGPISAAKGSRATIVGPRSSRVRLAGRAQKKMRKFMILDPPQEGQPKIVRQQVVAANEVEFLHIHRDGGSLC